MPMIRRVAIDDDVDAYVSPGPEIAPESASAEDPEEEWLVEERKDRFQANAEELHGWGWSTARVALELHTSEDEVRAVLSGSGLYGDGPNDRQTPEQAYGLEPEDDG